MTPLIALLQAWPIQRNPAESVHPVHPASFAHPWEAYLGAGLIVLVIVLTLDGVFRVRRRRFQDPPKRRRAVRDAVAKAFGLEPHALVFPFDVVWSLLAIKPGLGRTFAGEARGRPLTFAWHRGQAVATVTLPRPVLPPGARVIQVDSKPGEKKAERHSGGANQTGDDGFDARYLVYAEPEVARGLHRDLVHRLRETHVPGLTLDGTRLAGPLTGDPEAAVAEVKGLLDLAADLEATAPVTAAQAASR